MGLPGRDTLTNDFRAGYYSAADHIANFINSLDSADMTGRDVRSAIYGECLKMKPRKPEDTPNA